MNHQKHFTMNSSPLELYVKSLVEEQIRKDSDNRRSYGIHASSISGPCMRKIWYEINGIPFEYDLKTMGRFKLGRAVHEIIILNKRANEVDLAANVFERKKISPKDITSKNKFQCIIGRSDDFVTFNNMPVIVDKKTFSSKWDLGVPTQEKGPSEEYVFQLNTYKYLYYLKTGVELKQGCIAYVDVATGLSDIRVFELQLWDLETIRAKLLVKLDQLKGNDPPERIISWRCIKCPFNTKEICNAKGIVVDYDRLIKNK